MKRTTGNGNAYYRLDSGDAARVIHLSLIRNYRKVVRKVPTKDERNHMRIARERHALPSRRFQDWLEHEAVVLKALVRSGDHSGALRRALGTRSLMEGHGGGDLREVIRDMDGLVIPVLRVMAARAS